MDLVVAGGGISGVIAAARYGAKMMLVEPFACLGGDFGPGLFGAGLQMAAHEDSAEHPGLGGNVLGRHTDGVPPTNYLYPQAATARATSRAIDGPGRRGSSSAGGQT